MMKTLRTKIPAILMILLAVLLIPGIADAKTEKEYQGNLWNFEQTIQKTSGSYTFYAYPSKNQKEAWIYKIKIKGRNSSKLSIPSELDHKKVTRLGCRERAYFKEEYDDVDELPTIFGKGAQPWESNPASSYQIMRIKKLVLPNTVRVIQPTAFSGMSSIKTLKMPKNVETLGSYAFYGCFNLKNVTLSEKLKSLDALAFTDCPKLAEMKISPKNKTYQIKDRCVITKKKKELVYALTGGQTFQIPEGVKVIKKYAFANCDSSESQMQIHIPASVNKIEEAAFMNPAQYIETKSSIKNVTVDEANGVYAKDGQCIYNKIDKSLSVAIPDEKGVLYISDQVEKLTTEKSIAGINFRGEEEEMLKVVHSENLKTVIDEGFKFLDAKDIYLKGKNPPDVMKENVRKVKLPYSEHIYVPEGSKEVYRDWYLKHKEGGRSYIKTFQPDEEI